MPRSTIQINLRLQPDLRERIRDAAEKNGVSMTKEITARLEQSFQPKPTFAELQVSDRVAQFAGAIALVMERAGWLSAFFLTLGRNVEGLVKDGRLDFGGRFGTITVGAAKQVYMEAKTTWIDHPWPFAQAQLAATRLLELLQPKAQTLPPEPEGDYENFGRVAANEMIMELFLGPARPESPVEVERAEKFKALIGDVVVSRLKGNGPLIELLKAEKIEHLGIFGTRGRDITVNAASPAAGDNK